jgi:hypothetical protein
MASYPDEAVAWRFSTFKLDNGQRPEDEWVDRDASNAVELVFAYQRESEQDPVPIIGVTTYNCWNAEAKSFGVISGFDKKGKPIEYPSRRFTENGMAKTYKTWVDDNDYRRYDLKEPVDDEMPIIGFDVIPYIYQIIATTQNVSEVENILGTYDPPLEIEVVAYDDPIQDADEYRRLHELCEHIATSKDPALADFADSHGFNTDSNLETCETLMRFIMMVGSLAEETPM